MSSKRGKILVIAVATLALFFILILTRPYLLPLKLHIAGTIPDRAPFLIEWDSGAGYRPVESWNLRPGPAGTSLQLPQYSIRSIKVSPPTAAKNVDYGIILEACEDPSSPDTCREISASRTGTAEPTTIIVDQHERRGWRWSLAVIQFLVALFISLALVNTYSAWRSSRPLLPPHYPSIDRPTFLFSFAITFGSSLVWLLANWPAPLTYISLHNWSITRTLDFDYWNPWYYQLWLTALVQIVDSPSLVSLLQMFAMSSVVSLVFAWSVKKGASRLIAGAALLYFALSPLLSAWSTIIWFDIPYGILTVVAALLCYGLCYHQRYLKTALPRLRPWLLIFLFLSLVLLRRNGVLFLILLPAIFFVLKPIPRSRIVLYAAGLFLGYHAIQFAAERTLNLDAHTAKYIHPRVLSELQWKINPLFSLLRTGEGYVSDEYVEDRATIEKLVPLEVIKKRYNPHTVESLIWKLPRNLADEDIDRINQLYYRLIPRNPGAFLRERAQVFSNNLHNFIFHSSRSWRKFPHSRNIIPDTEYGTPLPAAAAYHRFLHRHALLHLMLLTPIPAMVILLIGLCFFRTLPATALYSFVILFQVPFLFLTLPGAESRYFFFLLPGALLLPALAQVERLTRRAKADDLDSAILQ